MAGRAKSYSEVGHFFAELRAVAGAAAAESLMERCGGLRVYIPFNRFSGRNQVALVWGGEEAANKILGKLREVGLTGIQIDIPQHRYASGFKRGQIIDQAILSDGCSAQELARRFGISERAIRLRRARLVACGLLKPIVPGQSAEVRQAIDDALFNESGSVKDMAARLGLSVGILYRRRSQLVAEGRLKPIEPYQGDQDRHIERDLLMDGASVNAIARTRKVGKAVIYRIKRRLIARGLLYSRERIRRNYV